MQLQPHPKSTPCHRQYHLLSFLRHKPAHLPDVCKCHSIARHPWCWLCLIPWDDVIASEWSTGVLLTTALYQYMLYSDLANLTSPDLLPRSSEALLELRNTRLLATPTTTILSNNTGRSMIMVTLFLSGLWAIDPLWLERNIWMRYPDNPIPSSILPRYSYHFVPFTENIIAHCNIGTCESRVEAETPRLHPVSLFFGRHPPWGFVSFESRAVDTGMWIYTRYILSDGANWFFIFYLPPFFSGCDGPLR